MGGLQSESATGSPQVAYNPSGVAERSPRTRTLAWRHVQPQRRPIVGYSCNIAGPMGTSPRRFTLGD